MKNCSKCGTLTDSYFAQRDTADGLRSACKACVTKSNSGYRDRHREAFNANRRLANKRNADKRGQKQREYAKANKLKVQARSAVLVAMRQGKLKRQPCEKCGSARYIQAHHDDYSKPLEVRWLCAICHKRHHAEIACHGLRVIEV